MSKFILSATLFLFIVSKSIEDQTFLINFVYRDVHIYQLIFYIQKKFSIIFLI